MEGLYLIHPFSFANFRVHTDIVNHGVLHLIFYGPSMFTPESVLCKRILFWFTFELRLRSWLELICPCLCWIISFHSDVILNGFPGCS